MKLFGISLVVSAVLEYFTSFIMDFIFDSFYWDYKEMFLNINGRICLAGILAFGIVAMFAVYVAAPSIMRIKRRLSDSRIKNIIIVLTVFFVIDLVYCIVYGFNSGDGVGGVYEAGLIRLGSALISG